VSTLQIVGISATKRNASRSPQVDVSLRRAWSDDPARSEAGTATWCGIVVNSATNPHEVGPAPALGPPSA
jgi:hypothetical protein